MQQLAQGLLITLLMLVTACGQRSDPQIIEGRWVAENFRIQSIQLPIGPELLISRNSIGLGSGLEPLRLSGIQADGNEVTLKTEFGFDVIFRFENKDRMYFTVPFIDHRIYYNRADDTRSASLSPAITVKNERTSESSGAFTAAAEQASPARSLQDAPVLEQALSNQGQNLQQPASETHYQQSLAFLRQGDVDASLRSLTAALVNGFADWQRIEQEKLFDQLHGDIRFQVLQARWRKE